MPIESGTKLGSYEVQEFIGEGAMGQVYRAYHAQLERAGAVKVLHGIAAGPDAAARFRHEAQAIAQMRHPNIVNVFDFGEYEGTPYMIVEFVPGGNLAGRMEQAPLDQASALRCLRGIAAGLDYAHSLGIIHRDVKPANVLLEKDGTPVLADFGLVKLLQGSSVKSMTGVTTGTPAYMAPEQVTGHQVGAAADRYSLATMAYEMLAGSIPFEGEGVLELLYAHVHREPPPPSSRNQALGPSVDAVILRGLAKDPQARWESCTAFVDALTAALAGAPVPAAERTVVMAGPATAPKPLAQSAVSLEPEPTRVANGRSAATVAMAMLPARPSPPAKAARPLRRLFKIAAGVVILLLVLLVGGICAAANQLTLEVNPTMAVPGERVTVISTHLPANQAGEVRLQSQLYTFKFQANSEGNLSQEITVPLDIVPGQHHVCLAWGGSCHGPTALLQVFAPGTLPTPTPSSHSSATPSGSPRATPSSHPGASPTPRASPKASPKATPKTSPSPRPPPPARSISFASTPHITILGGSLTVDGFHFSPGQIATVKFLVGSTVEAQKTAVVASDGTFVVTLNVPALSVGTGTVTACDPNGCAPSLSVPITVV